MFDCSSGDDFPFFSISGPNIHKAAAAGRRTHEIFFCRSCWRSKLQSYKKPQIWEYRSKKKQIWELHMCIRIFKTTMSSLLTVSPFLARFEFVHISYSRLGEYCPATCQHIHRSVGRNTALGLFWTYKNSSQNLERDKGQILHIEISGQLYRHTIRKHKSLAKSHGSYFNMQ
jgi:hypothetical protein